MPIQSLAGRADALPAARPVAVTGQSQSALARTPYAVDNGGIPGDLLRPGSIDQALFKAQLEAAQKGAAAAPQAPAQPHAKARSFVGIPTLTPAQLAALGVVKEPGGKCLVLDIPAPKPAAPGTGAGTEAERFPFLTRKSAAPTPLFSTAPRPPMGAPTVEAAPVATEAPASTGTSEGTATDAPTPEPPAPQSAAPAAVAPTKASAERGPIPGSRRGADGVWELTRLPDKDEREMLRGQKWRLVEREDSRQLFFGPDGKFGWDDFVDMINPLQHIPLVNLAYRAITGDEIYGAARMVDVAFGPLAGMSTVADLVLRDTTGQGIAENAVAALFGPGDMSTGDAPNADASTAEPPKGDAPTADALAGEVADINTASADHVQLADAGPLRRGSNK
jgi:hypothetical protein